MAKRFYKATGPRIGRDGGVTIETTYGSIETADLTPGGLLPSALGLDEASVVVELDRLPEPFERHDDALGWVVQAPEKAADEEDARFRSLSPRQLVALIVRQARRRMVEDLEATGIITKAQASALLLRIG